MLRDAINSWLQETSFRTALVASAAALLLIVAAVATALLVFGPGMVRALSTVVCATHNGPASTAAPSTAAPASSPQPRATAVPSASPGDGSMWRLADGKHGGDQVIQRPGQVVPGDQDHLVIDAKMIDRPSRNRAVGRRGSQGACDKFLPQAGVAGRRGVNHPAPHCAVRADLGHDDPHQLSLLRCAAFRHADGDNGGLRPHRAG